jgi:TRAP-type C4-dicarboxylate transport system permease small subunit
VGGGREALRGEDRPSRPRDDLGQTHVRTLIAIALIAAGTLGLIYGSFSYTKETHKAKIGSLELSLKEKETVNVPAWAGLASIAAGVVLLVIGKK